MENCVSKELESDNAMEKTKKVYQTLLLVKEKLADVVYGSEDQWGEDKLKMTLDDIEELYKNYPWLRELGRGYMIKKKVKYPFIYLWHFSHALSHLSVKMGHDCRRLTKEILCCPKGLAHCVTFLG